MSQRRIGFNAMFMLPTRGGMGTFARGLWSGISAVAPDLEPVIYANAETVAHLRDAEPGIRGARLVAMPASGRLRPLVRIAVELAGITARVRRDGVELLHSLANTGPVKCPVTSVMTMHDLLFRHFPATHPGAVRLGLHALTPLALRRADAVTVDSEHTADDVARSYPVAAHKLRVITPGPGKPITAGLDEATVRARLGLGSARVVLCIAVGFQSKNVGRLIDAFARTAAADTVLVHVGHAAFEGQGWRERARVLGIEDRVRWANDLGEVHDDLLEGLYGCASVLVAPSLFEGFGMTVLEAMARGVPVVCSNATSHPESGGDAVAYFDPRDVTSIATAIDAVLADPVRQRELVRLGAERVRRFSWERVARAHVALYEELLAGDGPAVTGSRTPSTQPV